MSMPDAARARPLAPRAGIASAPREPPGTSGAAGRLRPAESADPSAPCPRPCGSRRREAFGRRDRRRAYAMRASWGRPFKHEPRPARVPGADSARKRAAECRLDRPCRLAAGAAAAAAFPLGGWRIGFAAHGPNPSQGTDLALPGHDRPRSPAGRRSREPAPGRAATPPQAENSSTSESSAPSNTSRSAAPTGSMRILSMRA